MQTFHPDFELNIKACAFTYLMAKTEAIMTHDQECFIERTDCGTAGCLAGHAALYEAGSIKRIDERHCSVQRIATEALFGYASRYSDQLGRLFCDHVVSEMDEQQALRNFKRLVRFAATPEEWEEFKRLTTLDTQELLPQSPVAV